ncbi:hypothetical protein PPYR_15666 [Photinus pyralis]|uniref:C2H2-type domain-containing protein n=1 Tax=Photinus pyralis TaxID=7054 RepID=A0A5N4A0A9_PHOPY|nr:uncharacterized protein LOC116182856 isoform X2 [Photinus pyralis]KAB0790736.1 hypothetical protein PPYR_15666 [Photinus pyralis]
MFNCPKCNKSFTLRSSVLRHLKTSCAVQEPALKKKVKITHGGQRYCDTCFEHISTRDYVGHLRTTKHKNNSLVFSTEGVDVVKSAFKSRIISYRITPNKQFIVLKEFTRSLTDVIQKLVREQIGIMGSLKVNCELFGHFILEAKERGDVKSFNTRNQILTVSSDLSEWFNDVISKFEADASEFQERDSGWALQQWLYIELNINRYNPLRASSFIPTPSFISRKRATINVRNNDFACFGWALMSAIDTPTGPPCQPESYRHYSELFNFDGITFPVKLDAIAKFEENNPLSINVYGLEEDTQKDGKVVYKIVGPLHYTKQKKTLHVNLLYLTSVDGNSHYCWIQDMSRLISMQVSKHKEAIYLCDGCLVYFATEEKLWRHSIFDCNYVRTFLPTTEPIVTKWGESSFQNQLKFDNYQKRLKLPFVVYADFECLLKSIHGPEPNPLLQFTTNTFEHNPYSFAYYIKCSFDDSYSKFQTYRGPDAALQFVNMIESDIRTLYNQHFKHAKPLPKLTIEEQRKYDSATICWICEKTFLDGDVRVLDHCHWSGVMRGISHSTCNLQLQNPNFVPVFFHNLTGYDAHMFVKCLALENENIDVIATNKEKYVSFTKHISVDQIVENGVPKNVIWRIRFVDSFRFLGSSLNVLSKNLSDSECNEIKTFFGTGRAFELIRQKGVFPYSFVDAFDKLDQTQLPNKADFFDKLHEQHITEDEYSRAQDVWNLFQCQTLGEYSDIYLKSDVLLLADIFENYRRVCLHNYQLDPAQYFTAPGLSWDAMLKKTGVELELLTDIDMLNFFKGGVRGGVSTCTKRRAIANNKFLANYDPSKPSSYIVYLDACNLYGHSMRQYLPQRDFVWLTPQEIKSFEVSKILDESDTGYVLEVDLEYPEQLHETHNDMPFCPESMTPPNSTSKYPKLIPNLNRKEKYVIHYRSLKQCLQHGLVLQKIHRGIKFTQSPWLRTYIDLNTELRNRETSESGRNTVKTMTNSIFGKTMENVDKRVDIKLVSHWERIGRKLGAEGHISKPNFKNLSVFSENLVAVQMSKVSVTYDKPVYVGFSILDLSKTVMYEFFYDFLKPMYREKVTLLYTDTDSLVLEIFTDNFYEDMISHLDRFDTSKFPVNNLHGVPRNISVVGKMRDEYSGVPISSFYGAGAKSYCVNVGDHVDKKAKGVKKYVIKNCLKEDDYKKVVEEGGVIIKKMSGFRSHLHTMYTEMRNKIALSSTDDKRYVIPGTVKTLAWGHRDIKSIKSLNDLINSFQ